MHDMCVCVPLCHGTHLNVNSTLSLHSTQGTPGSINQLRRLARRGLLRLSNASGDQTAATTRNRGTFGVAFKMPANDPRAVN